MQPVLIAALTVLVTFAGGYFVIKKQNYLHYILSFTAGVLIGLVAFDLLPELFHTLEETNQDPTTAMVALVVGFLAFHITEKIIMIRHGDSHTGHDHYHNQVGLASAAAITAHSLLDGLAIGLAFQANQGVGFAVAAAVIAHRFSDGINVVGLLLAHKNSTRRAWLWLTAVALAPIVGALVTLLFTLSDGAIVLYLGFISGFLLHIVATEVLPAAHSEKSSLKNIALTIFGVGFIFTIVQFAIH